VRAVLDHHAVSVIFYQNYPLSCSEPKDEELSQKQTRAPGSQQRTQVIRGLVAAGAVRKLGSSRRHDAASRSRADTPHKTRTAGFSVAERFKPNQR